MSHVPHELAEEFPNAIEKLHELKTTNRHFTKLAEEYHTINRTIHRIETDVEPATDERSVQLRKHRLKLKDEIAAMLS